MSSRTIVLSVVAMAFGLSLTACSGLTRPDEITIAAEPPPMPKAPAAPALPAGQAAPVRPPGTG